MGYCRIIGISFLTAVIGPVIIGVLPTGGWAPSYVLESWEDAIGYWVVFGPVIFVGCILFLLRNEWRSKRSDKYPRTELNEFSSEDEGRIIEFSLDPNGSDGITLRVVILFQCNQELGSGERIGFSIAFDRKGGSKVKIQCDETNPARSGKILSLLNDADPPIVPIKWKPGVLTISDAGMEYTEGPYDLGPVSEEGIVGNLTIVEALKGVVDEVEAIWMAANRKEEPES